MAYFRKKYDVVKEELRTDSTLNTAGAYVQDAPRSLLPAARQYVLDKAPIISWLPRYSPSWLLPDAIAGLTIGVLLIPQGLAYAKIATIPIEVGLYSCWLPAAIGVFMSTSKDLSVGPTSMLGLLTAEIVRDLQNDFSPTQIASAVSLMVGIYSLALGLLGLGFLLDYVSVPVLTGFISATALTIGFGQVGSLVGLDGTPDMVFDVIGDVLRRLPRWNGPTCALGITSILLLIALQRFGTSPWARRHFALKYLSSSRAVLVMILYTLISYLVNRSRSSPDDFAWAVTKVSTRGVPHPQRHDGALLARVAVRAVAPLVACTLEHLAVGKSFGRRNGYAIDQSQELNWLGVANIVNSFFSSMPCGGAMSRTAVNSECRVRSPLSGAVTTGFIILVLYVASPALYWLPKTTLSAIIIMAVIHLFGPLSVVWRYWRVSLADFIACQVSFWVTIFVTAEIAIGAAVAWSIVWALVRQALMTRPGVITSTTTAAGNSLDSNSNHSANHRRRRRTNSSVDQPNLVYLSKMSRPPTHDDEYEDNNEGGKAARNNTNNNDIDLESGRVSASAISNANNGTLLLAPDTALIQFADSIFFPNANRVKVSAVEAVSIIFPSVSPSPSSSSTTATSTERSWSVAGQRRLERLREERGLLTGNRAPPPPLAVVVWDMSRVPWMDVTGVLALGELKDDIRRQLGGEVVVRIVGLNRGVRDKLERAKWPLADYGDDSNISSSISGSGDEDRGPGRERCRDEVKVDYVFDDLNHAIWHRERPRTCTGRAPASAAGAAAGTAVLQGVSSEKAE